ncbi:hypothetical protein [Burkholderia ambifaria]|uniref:hypothetical protein n=1 Tax=Burkholderia ambifaria TaxID=152480 RepID=UPI00158EDA0C|nr:hypothetical protein [Burkholderia ambifaria]
MAHIFNAPDNSRQNRARKIEHLRREMFNPIRQKTGLPIAPDPPELNFPRPPPQNPAKSAVSRRRPVPQRQPTHFNDIDQHLTH